MKIIVRIDKIGKFTDWLLNLIKRRVTIGFLAIAISLTGCVKYDTGINFSSLGDGEIVEHIQLSEQLNSFSQTAVKTWLTSIEQRTIAAQGHLERLNDREFKAIIPFNNPEELVTKINHYFNPAPNSQASSQLNALMKIDRSNFLVVIRNHLICDVDLRSLAAADATDRVAIGANNLVNLDFSLQSPWGVKNSGSNGSNIGSVIGRDRQMTWQLKPGKIDRIDVVFWLPNPLGIGAIIIILISMAGYYFKYRQLPWQLTSKIG